MIKVSFLFFVFFSLKATCQNLLLADTAMLKALSPEGYRNPKNSFENFTAIATDGKGYIRDSLENKITFINFWFEACVPCIAEFDGLNKLYNKYKTNKNFQFLSFTFETRENALRVANEYHLEYPIICVEKENLYKLIFNLGFPTSIVTNKRGKISFIKCGGFREKEKMNMVADSLLSIEIEHLLFPS